MQIRYVQCNVVRDPMVKIPRQFPAWELEMLETVYGLSSLEDLTEVIVDDAPAPLSPEDELARLAKHYGREKHDDGSAGENWAGIAYGRGKDGVRRMEQLMREAIVDLPPSAAKSKAAAKPKAAAKTEAPDPEDGNGE